MTGRVLLVEDDAAVREALAQTLELADLVPIQAGSFVAAKDRITRDFPGVILSDIRMPGRDGFHLLDYACDVDDELPVVLLTGEGDIPMAVRAMERGAFGFLEKPCAPAELVATLTRALEARQGVLGQRAARDRAETGDPAARLIFGVSDLAEGLRARVRRIAALETPVLIEGAPGTGISKVAEVIHLSSPRSKGPFEKRAAAGLDRAGLEAALAAAAGGALFLDEIVQLPADTQIALIEALEARQVTRIMAGSSQEPGVLEDGERLNPELYYRLQVAGLRVPSLAERPEDIPVLFRNYVAQAAEQAGIKAPEIRADHVAALMVQDWPGNARSLMSAAMRFVLGMSDDVAAAAELGLAEQMARVERSLLIAALGRQNGRASEAAKALKLPRKTFYDKLAKYGIRPEDFRRQRGLDRRVGYFGKDEAGESRGEDVRFSAQIALALVWFFAQGARRGPAGTGASHWKNLVNRFQGAAGSRLVVSAMLLCMMRDQRASLRAGGRNVDIAPPHRTFTREETPMKTILKATAAIALCFGATSAMAACDDGEIVVKFAHVTNTDKHPKGIAASLLESRVNDEMNGTMCMEVYPNSTLYNDDQVLEAMLQGDVQLAAPSLSKFETFTKQFRIFDLPFMFKNIEAVDAFQASETGQAMKDSMTRRGLQGLEFWHNGMKQFSANKPLMLPGDAAGLKFRVQPSDVLVAQMEALDASPQPMAFSEVYGALQQGVVDGQENTWSNIYGQKFFEVQDGTTETNHGVLDYLVVTSVDWLDSLDADVRDQFLTILQEVTAERNAAVGQVDMEARQAILDAGGEIRELDAEARQAWVDAMKPVWEQFEGDVGAENIEAAQSINASM